jgi:hypothetical protein
MRYRLPCKRARRPGRAGDLLASLAASKPGVEDPDRVIETVGTADRNEGLTTDNRTGASQGVERGHRQLRLRERPRLIED